MKGASKMLKPYHIVKEDIDTGLRYHHYYMAENELKALEQHMRSFNIKANIFKTASGSVFSYKGYIHYNYNALGEDLRVC